MPVTVSLRACSLLACSLLLVGCGKGESDGLETVPVKGKVVFTKGGTVESLAARNAAVQFELVDDPKIKASGAIEEDGSFTVATSFGEDGKPGAVAGKHRVRLMIDDGFESRVARKFLSFEKSGITVTVPSDEEIVIEVWK